MANGEARPTARQPRCHHVPVHLSKQWPRKARKRPRQARVEHRTGDTKDGHGSDGGSDRRSTFDVRRDHEPDQLLGDKAVVGRAKRISSPKGNDFVGRRSWVPFKGTEAPLVSHRRSRCRAVEGGMGLCGIGVRGGVRQLRRLRHAMCAVETLRLSTSEALTHSFRCRWPPPPNP